MSTTLAKPAEMADRKWYVIDAAGKPLGRVAAKAAVILRGKNKTTFTPNVDCGDLLTGKKLEKKFHRTHSGWIGGLKETQYKTLMAEASDKAMTYAVKGMVPSNTLGAKAMTRLHCYKTAEHAHAAQSKRLADAFCRQICKMVSTMPVFRVEKNSNYTTMCNYHLRDQGLSLKGKGLLSMLLSLPDTWNYSVRGLSSITPDGVDGVLTAGAEFALYAEKRTPESWNTRAMTDCCIAETDWCSAYAGAVQGKALGQRQDCSLPLQMPAGSDGGKETPG